MSHSLGENSLSGGSATTTPTEQLVEAFTSLDADLDAKVIQACHALTNGASIEDASKTLRTSLLGRAMMTGNPELISTLLQHGATANDYIPRTQTTVLLYAIDQNRKDLAQLLLDHKADPDGEDVLRRTPLSQALLKADYDFVKMVVDAGADVTVETENKSLHGSLTVVRALGREDILLLLGIDDATPYGVRPSTPSPFSHRSGRKW